LSVIQREGRYRFKERIGAGAFGEVFRAEVEGGGAYCRDVAIKVFRSADPRDATLKELFATEASILRDLRHGNIVQVLDAGELDGQPYLVMELVEGCDLARILRQAKESGERLPLGASLHIFEQTAQGLSFAHSRVGQKQHRVVHRDLSPKNILISADGVVKIADFGIARVLEQPSRTMSGVIKGTPLYMAPEQIFGDRADERTDVFALGLILREMLSGEHPLEAAHTEGFSALRAAALAGIPRLQAEGPVDEALVDIVARAVEAEPEDRHQSVELFLREVVAWRAERNLEVSFSALAPIASRDNATAKTFNLKIAAPDRPERPTVEAPQPAADASPKRMLIVAGMALGFVALLAVWLVTRWRGDSDDRVEVASAVAETESTMVAGPTGKSPPVTPSLPADAVVTGLAERPQPAVNTSVRDLGRKKRAPKRTLRVNLMPYADVLIDGKYVGTTPLEAKLSVGPHRMELRNPKTGLRKRRTIHIETNAENVITEW
jgi:serine/threonine-protein kinase